VFGADGALVRAHSVASNGAGESPTTAAWEWDGRDGDGRMLASGVYFVQVEASGLRSSRKILLAR
jgi:flagellar hook assembly protein FlgD